MADPIGSPLLVLTPYLYMLAMLDASRSLLCFTHTQVCNAHMHNTFKQVFMKIPIQTWINININIICSPISCFDIHHNFLKATLHLSVCLPHSIPFHDNGPNPNPDMPFMTMVPTLQTSLPLQPCLAFFFLSGSHTPPHLHPFTGQARSSSGTFWFPCGLWCISEPLQVGLLALNLVKRTAAAQFAHL